MDQLIELGLVGLFIMSFLAATILPIGVESILSAMLIQGSFNFTWLLIVATVGNWLGAMLGYYMGYLGKWEWIERYLKIKREKVEKLQTRVIKHGSVLALVCWLPAVGDFIAIALGLFKVSWKRVALFMFLGKGLRFVVWAYLTLWIWKQV